MIDVWFDSGSMPFAQWGAPLRNLASFEQAYPAQFICEAIDQTRGWFYSLMAVGTLVFGRSPYENVVCLGLVMDESGRKMSKHLGNVIEPMGLMNSHGADAVRWFFAASGSPWAPAADRAARARRDRAQGAAHLLEHRVVPGAVRERGRRGGAGAAWTPEAAASAPAAADRPLLDRWLLSEVHACVRDVTAALEAFDTATAGRRLAGLIDDLSNWYVRRSRRRFWDGPGSADGASAFATLHSALAAVTAMMAPITPFLADYLWGVLRPADAPESVHLAAWPTWDADLIDPSLSAQMALARRLVELGRSARSAASVRTRQPLGRALVGAAGFAALPAGAARPDRGGAERARGRAARRGRRRAGHLHGQARVPRARQAVRLIDPGGRGRDQGGRPGGAGARRRRPTGIWRSWRRCRSSARSR